MRILLVEDETQIREIIRTYAVGEGHEITETGTGKEALSLIDSEEFDIAVLDVMLPDTDGWTILRHLRKETRIPAIMLTARGEEDDKLLGFELGAEDYMTKPFSVKELMARIRNVRRRNEPETESPIIRVGNVTVNTSYHEVEVNGEKVTLSPLEYRLLMFFIENRNLAMSRNQILNGVWGYDYFGDERTVDTHVRRLRSKLSDDGDLILTIRGHGYRMVGE